MSVIGMMTVDGLVDAYCTTGTVDSDVFCDFVEKNLLPQLMPFNSTNPRSIVIMDNATIHHNQRALQLIESVGALVHFLPPYSPDFNPIEELFSKIKYLLKENDAAIQASHDNMIEDFVVAAFSLITVDDCYGWSKNCGYVL